ncbi:hypothetical protein X777_09628 [Ooceraea biroi]|uniref:Uncharacterized protein n=1 Tax=Ooceraea biroi TaxID=2015173 RepID=A0A026W768_OOCBI|nr:hypothetical protein X777_09628 [Ooceraea biroi]
MINRCVCGLYGTVFPQCRDRCETGTNSFFSFFYDSLANGVYFSRMKEVRDTAVINLRQTRMHRVCIEV